MSDHDPDEVPRAPEIIEHESAQDAAVHAPPPPERVVVTKPRGGTPLPLTLLLFAALAGGLAWVWKHPAGEAAAPAAEADPGPAIEAAKAQLAAQIQALSGRIDALEKSPPAAPPAGQDALAPLARRLDDVSGTLATLSSRQDAQAAEIQKLADSAASRPAPSPTGPAADQGPETATLAAGLQAAESKLDQALAQQKAALDGLDQRLGKLEQAAPAAPAADQPQDKAALDALAARVGKLEQGAGQAQGVAQDATLAIRLEAAEAALAAGQPLGPLPDAPPALARFATTPPPTEAALRAGFDQVAEAARKASRPDLDHESFFQRALARVQQTVTVRQGDHVIVGDPAAGILARAQTDVGNGDLKGAVAALQGLNGPAKAAVAGWVAQVQALLDARAALALLAAHG